MAEAKAKADGRDVIERRDLPITKGLQQTIHEYRRLDVDGELRAMLAELAVRPQLDLAVSDEIDETLPEIAGGLSLALGRTFRIIDPRARNPQTEQWQRAIQSLRSPALIDWPAELRAPSRTRLAEERRDTRLEGGLRHGPDDPVELAAVLHHHHRGDAHCPEPLTERAIVIDVDLDDLEPARVLAGQLLEDRRDEPARAAPRRPQVDEDGRGRVRASTSNVASVASTTHGRGLPQVPQCGDPRGSGGSILAPQFGQTRIERSPAGAAGRAVVADSVAISRLLPGVGTPSASSRTWSASSASRNVIFPDGAPPARSEFEVGLVVARRDESVRIPISECAGEDLLPDAADRQDLAAQGDLPGHRQVVAHRAAGGKRGQAVAS